MELSFIKLIQSIHTPALDSFMQFISLLAEQGVLAVLLITVYWCVDKHTGQFLIFTVLTSLCLNQGIKNTLQMPRPFTLYPGQVRVLRMETADGYSFPSGHTQAMATFLGACAMCVRKRWFWILAAVGTALVALSRVYLGVHFPKDVIGGALLGLLAVLFCSLLYREKYKKYLPYMVGATCLLVCSFAFFSYNTLGQAGYFQALGALIGFAVGIFLEKRYLNFMTKVPVLKRLARFGLGFLSLGVLLWVTPYLLPWETALFWFIKTALLAFFITFIYPFIFTRLKF